MDYKDFPTTRYQGSKRKLLPWIFNNISFLNFDCALDVFGGTGIVSYLFKRMGKRVVFNDYLKSNYLTGKSFIENKNVLLDDIDIKFLLAHHQTIQYSTFVQDTFSGIYYTENENRWIDLFLGNWTNLSNLYSREVAQYKSALAFFAFAQSALKKRPFNLFHRANLDLRLKNVKRSFGNKTSWEGSFSDYFKYFVKEANRSVFSNGRDNIALNHRASSIDPLDDYDLVYVDPPYVRKEAQGPDVDYMHFYHFLEGASTPRGWGDLIDYGTKNLRLRQEERNAWIHAKDNRIAFEELFEKFRNAIIVVSYKEPGIPTKRQLIYSLKKFKKSVISFPGIEYNYALNKNNGFHKEYMLIGLDS